MKEVETKKTKKDKPISLKPRQYGTSALLKAGILAAALVVLVIVEVIIISSAAREAASSVTYSNYISAATQTADKLSRKMDDLFLSDGASADIKGSISGNSVIIDGTTYSVNEETERVNLLSGYAVISDLSDIARGASSGEVYIIIPDDIVSPYYKEPEEDTPSEEEKSDEDAEEDSEENSDAPDEAENGITFLADTITSESATLYFYRVENIKNELLSGSVEGFAIVSAAGRIIWADGGKLSGYISDYAAQILENPSTVYVSSGDSATSLCAYKVGNSDYYVCVFDNFVERASAYSSLSGKVAMIVGICGAVSIAVFLAAAFIQFRGEGKFKTSYHLTTDLNGQIVSANQAFKDDFPKIVEIKENIAYFDSTEYNVLRIKNVKGDEVTLACTVEQKADKLKVNADVLSLPVGKDILSAGENMRNAYEVFREKDKRNIVGFVKIGNLDNFKSMFGEEFALSVRAQICSKLAEKFVFTYEDDDKTIGVLCRDGKTLENLLQDMPDIVTYVNKPVAVEGNLVNPDVKFGFALVDSSMTDTSFAYVNTAASAALNRAIKDHEKQYYIYQEAQKKIYAKYFISYDIPKMLSENAFEMQYQPQYSIKDERIVGFEALFRVKENAVANANIFELISYAERTGTMILLSEFIFDTGMRFAKSIEGKNVSISLNVSPVQLMQAGFVDSFLKIYHRYDLKPGAICVEITESFLMTTFDETVKKLNILRDAGINIHLDDFGTRYSSLLYLKKLPISTIKIDKEFIDDILKNDYSHAVTQMVIDICEAVHLSNISEGVETKEQYLMLKEMGGSIVQGYLIGKSMKEDVARETIDTFKLEL